MSTDHEITLRPPTLEDADIYASWGQDPDFCAAAEWTAGLALESRCRFHRGNVASPPGGMHRLSALHQGQVVGYVDLHGTGHQERELGYVIGPSSQWGRGLGTLVAHAGLRYGFEQLHLQRIVAEALDANRASVRILQRLGMTESGRGDDGEYLGRATFYRQFVISAPAL